ncbi:MAG TPA: hypothetical protein VHT34_08625 [Clostridia bacterium]|nr:hypothetical protein [Clostridia bacterium]
MKKEDELLLIKDYVDEIKSMSEQSSLSFNEKQQLKKAYDTYFDLYADAEKGKIDPGVLHENISSFLYMLQ